MSKTESFHKEENEEGMVEVRQAEQQTPVRIDFKTIIHFTIQLTKTGILGTFSTRVLATKPETFSLNMSI